MSTANDFLQKLQSATVKSTVQQKQKSRPNASAAELSKMLMAATGQGLSLIHIYLVMESDDELGLMKGSYSSTMEKVAADVYDKMVNSSIDGNGYLNFQSWDDLGLVFSLDEESQLVVQYGEEKEQ